VGVTQHCCYKMAVIVDTTTPAQSTLLNVMVILSSILSLLGATQPAYKLWYEKRKEFSIAQQYFSILIFMNVFTACQYAFGTVAAKSNGFCQFQAIIIQTGGLATQIFTAYISIKMYYLIVKRYSPHKLLKGIDKHVGIIYFISLSYALIIYSVGAYGVDTDWCWIDSGKDEALRYYALYISLIIVMMITGGSLLYVGLTVKGSSDASLAEAEKRVEHKLRYYVLIFNFCWVWGLLNRIIESSTGHTNFTASLLQAMFQPLQGFLNSIIYTNTHTKIYEHFYGKSKESDDAAPAIKFHFQQNVNKEQQANMDIERGSVALSTSISPIYQGSELDQIRDSDNGNRKSSIIARNTNFVQNIGHHIPLVAHMNAWESYEYLLKGTNGFTSCDSGKGTFEFTPKVYSIFTSTFNMGEARVKDLLDDINQWLMPDHDIYAIGLQEALDIAKIRDAMHNFLGGPSKYVMFGEEIGSDNTMAGYHGFIAITVFARKTEVDAGFIRETVASRKNLATGANLGAVKASNKGAVGIPFQIHDTNVSFLTCHLPSDSKGVRKLKRRNEAAHDILSQLCLSPTDLDWSSHKLSDHFFFTGDLNYRITGGADENDMSEGGVVCEDVAKAAIVEKTQVLQKCHPSLNGLTWRELRAQLMRSIKNDPKCPKGEELEGLLQARNHAALDWVEVLKNEELTCTMKHGFALNGFEEPTISFAPTYKRKIGHSSDMKHCGDYTNPAEVFDGFSNTEGMSMNERNGDEESEAELEKTVAQLKSEAKTKSKMRPPSYTDRVLVHSLPNRTKRLALQSYDTCEGMVISDHRPVSLVSTLTVNSSVLYPLNFVDELDINAWKEKANPNNKIRLLGKHQFYFFEVNITDLKVNLLVDDFIRSDNDTGEDGANSPLRKSQELKKTLSSKGTKNMSMLEEENEESVRSSTFVDVNLDSSKNIIEEAVALPTSKKKALKRRSTLKQLVKMVFKAPKGEGSDHDTTSRRTLTKEITKIKVTFPLPNKDPLVPFRRISDLAKAFEVEKENILDSFQNVALQALEYKYRNSRKAEIATDRNAIKSSTSEFNANVERKEDITKSTDVNGDATQVHNHVVTGNAMRVVGCAIPELGSHVLIGIADADGKSHGDMCVSLTEIMDLSNNNTHRFFKENIPVSAGGELRGRASGHFSISLLTIVSLADIHHHAHRKDSIKFPDPIHRPAHEIANTVVAPLPAAGPPK
jgi:hypothetical protein